MFNICSELALAINKYYMAYNKHFTIHKHWICQMHSGWFIFGTHMRGFQVVKKIAFVSTVSWHNSTTQFTEWALLVGGCRITSRSLSRLRCLSILIQAEMFASSGLALAWLLTHWLAQGVQRPCSMFFVVVKDTNLNSLDLYFIPDRNTLLNTFIIYRDIHDVAKSL